METNTGKREDFFRELIEKRRQLIEALDANKGEVNLDIFEDFYPDKAHFIYELLQNAEDADATDITFTLTADCLICEHDGRRQFSEADVSAITGIHNSTKDQASDKIGKFGVGFKSVFVYTQSPAIQSGDFAFRIIKLILPEPIMSDTSLKNRTRFEFPFNNPKKPAKEAYEEIASGLQDLDETTLLFLSSLQTIRWKIGTEDGGEVLRHQHSESHYEVMKQDDKKTTSSSHFLKFSEPVLGHEKQCVAIAFPLDFLPGVREFETNKPLAEQMRIVPAAPGHVAVFFTAAKETSGLFFHLHAPFVPELSRASIKETSANYPLFDQLATLSAQSLHRIRDLGLLAPEFLAILPIPQDQIPPRYQSIRNAIVAEMQSRALTPTYSRGHAKAGRLIQAKASLKDLLSENDIEYLVNYEGEPPLWAIGATQKSSRIDNFLTALAIREWGISEFVNVLKNNLTTTWRNGPDENFIGWLNNKSIGWIRQFYALLHDELSESNAISRLRDLKIVRLSNGTLGIAGQTYFPASDSKIRDLPTVDIALYMTGKSKAQQDKAKKFLLELGVREIGEAEEIEVILKARYTKEAEVPNDKIYMKDLRRFVNLTEKQPERKSIFEGYYIFQGQDETWRTPDGIYLDMPYKETDLSAYYDSLGEDADCIALHERYRDCGGLAPERLGKFAEAVGVLTKLAIKNGLCSHNLNWSYLRSVPGERTTSPIDRDYYVPHLRELLQSPNIALSRLVWRNIATLSQFSNYFKATYQRNYSSGAHYTASRLLCDLQELNWVPQSDGLFARPQDALREMLPDGFPFDPSYGGLKALKFGESAARKTIELDQKDDVAKAAGFSNAIALDRARRFATLPTEEQERFLLERENIIQLAAVPDRDLINPARHAQTVATQARSAPNKVSEIRERSVSIGREEVKESATQYLQRHYRNAQGDMTCQICKQKPLPFKLDDGSDFFEVVEFLPELRKRHSQNYLALCPNHSAMYRHANASREEMQKSFLGMNGNELEVMLGQKEWAIYFSKIHIFDLKAILKIELETADDAAPEELAEKSVMT